MREKANAQKDSSVGVGHVPWVVVHAEPLPHYRLRVRFVDGTEGVVDASQLILGDDPGVFAALRDPAVFAQVRIAEGAVTWPGDVDLAPDAMYDEIRAHGGSYTIPEF